VTIDGTFSNNQFLVNLNNSGLNYYSQENYKINSFQINGFDYFDIEIPLEHTPKNSEQVIVYNWGDRIPKTNFFYYGEPYTYERNFEYNESNNSIIIRTYQMGLLYWGNESGVFQFSIDYQH
jgi:hypothetical protein